MQYSRAKETYLRACSHTPSALTWHGVGVACYRLGQYEEAEEALCEANILNNQDPEVWAYLAMVCLQVGGCGLDIFATLFFIMMTGYSLFLFVFALFFVCFYNKKYYVSC